MKYDDAVDFYNAGKYEEAITAFTALNGYKDSLEQVVKCKTAIKDAQYYSAVELYNAKEYEDAYKAFIALDFYKDSADKATQCLFLKQKAGLTNITVGSKIKFGYYEQDNNIFNGEEEIEWKVLAIESNKALVISQYALDCQKYNSTNTDVTWEKCTLRTWLNGKFWHAAFSLDHQKMIIRSNITADKNPSSSTSPGNSTTDRVFLLSIDEVNKYFSSNSERLCQGTAYFYAQRETTTSNGGYCWWWLRSPGLSSKHATSVLRSGNVNYNGDYVNDIGGAIRPALWLSLES